MNTLDAIQARRSVRAFQPRPVEAEKLDALLNAINQAPSAGNLQAYQVYLVRRETTRQRLAAAALGQKFLAQAPMVLVVCACPSRSAKYGQRGAELYCLQDATVAVAYGQLAATALGLASCWVGAFDESQVKEVLGLPAAERPVAMLPIGYPAETPPRTPRRWLTDLVKEKE
ncbi:MAG TPA: nitroreductase family protein [Verrucomicrobiota bacterium]|nr:nitroreductase family protein [Verrucomicrobiota bacterium]HNU52318.1 nitroreductase family protein [Verrucomicrobiota bacterium]